MSQKHFMSTTSIFLLLRRPGGGTSQRDRGQTECDVRQQRTDRGHPGCVVASASWIVLILGLRRSVSPGLGCAVDVVALAVLLMIHITNRALVPEILLGLEIVLWRATSFGLVHLFTEYVIMITFNEYNWDTPPGTGWITTAGFTAGTAAGSVMAR